MNKTIIVILLNVNGWIAVLIGSLIALDPVAMIGSHALAGDPSIGMLSELRAPGGLLVGCGLIIVRSAMNSDLFARGLLLSALVYGGYGGARLIAIALDGLPPMGILIATGIELALFFITIGVIHKHHQYTHFSIAN